MGDDWWFDGKLHESGRLPLLVCFAAFIVTFVTTRVITRLIRAGKGPFHDNVSKGGLHVHHAVPGIILLIVGAFTAVAVDADAGWAIVAALLIGVGTSLVLDEFALILHLEDVYWSDEGRISVEMVSLAVACLSLVLIGISPFTMPDDASGWAGWAAALLIVVPHVLIILTCVAKAKYKMALFGTFLPLVALVGALRLARPESRWAKRYGPERKERAAQRAARYDERFGPMLQWATDFVSGIPPDPRSSP